MKRHKSDVSHARLDNVSRISKAKNILSILQYRTNLRDCKVLDIGTGSGTIASLLSNEAKEVYSVDIYDERVDKKGYNFKKVKNENLPFKDATFDVVVSNHVIEHTPDRNKHINEAMRVLKKGGVLYIATPNKFWLTDPHYRIPFVSWLPRWLADDYVKITRGKEKAWDIYPCSKIYLLRSLSKNEIHQEFKPMLKIIFQKKSLVLSSFVNILPNSLFNLLQYFSPTLNFTVIKK